MSQIEGNNIKTIPEYPEMNPSSVDISALNKFKDTPSVQFDQKLSKSTVRSTSRRKESSRNSLSFNQEPKLSDETSVETRKLFSMIGIGKM